MTGVQTCALPICYIDRRDIGKAARLALELPDLGYEVFYVLGYRSATRWLTWPTPANVSGGPLTTTSQSSSPGRMGEESQRPEPPLHDGLPEASWIDARQMAVSRAARRWPG